MNDDNIKWIDIGEKLTKELLKRKQQEYGDFDGNSYIVSRFIKSTLEVINKKKIDIFPMAVGLDKVYYRGASLINNNVCT